MTRTKKRLGAALATATMLAGTPALAAPSREAALEARVQALEGALAELRAELQASRAETAASQAQAMDAARSASSQAEAVQVRVAAMEGKPATTAEGFRIGQAGVKIGGFIKTVASFSHYNGGSVPERGLARDFYVPQTIPVGGTGSNNQDFSAKQTRLFLSLDTVVGDHKLKGYIETDFETPEAALLAGNERVTNRYVPSLRRGFVQFDNLLVGQDWSTFQYTGALPETTDFVGPTEGTPFVRQPMVRYSLPLTKEAVLHVSAENPETASATGSAPALANNDTDKLPDFAARLAYAGSFGELSLAGLVRQLSVDSGGVRAKASGWGVSGGARVYLNTAKSADVRLLATYGRGIGRYLGLNFAPDAIFLAGDEDLETPSIFAALAALRVPLGERVRINVMGGVQDVDYPDGFAPGFFDAFNKRAWSLAGNVFFSPVKQLDLGVEYRHGTRELVSGLEGALDRLEFAAKYSF